MLPVYKAISFSSIIKKGGRTEPWVMLVKADESIRPYVVKIFESDLIETRDSVTNEVLGNILAKEFNLPVPNAALIEFDENFISTIRNLSLLDLLDQRDSRLKFGSELLEGYINFDPSAFSLNDVRKIIDIDSVYAFDNLIRNADRKFKLKPNILIRSDKAFLIDHELGFERIGEEAINGMKEWNWDRKFCNYHIFEKHLKESPYKIKNEYFNEFEEYLKYLNIGTLAPYFNQLLTCGFSGKNHSLIRNYLTEMKNNSSKFVDVIRGTII